MPFHPVTRWIYLPSAMGLMLVTALSACSASGSSSTQNPQNAQGSFSAAPTQVHPTAQSAPPAVPPGTGSPTPAAGGASASAASQITADWNAFFSSATPDSKRVQLLQNGSAFASSIKAFASSPLAAAVTTKVDSVTVSSATQAKVTYDLSAQGKTVVKDASGTAVQEDGTWKVGDDVFCGLLSQAKSAGLSIAVPSACSSPS